MKGLLPNPQERLNQAPDPKALINPREKVNRKMAKILQSKVEGSLWEGALLLKSNSLSPKIREDNLNQKASPILRPKGNHNQKERDLLVDQEKVKMSLYLRDQREAQVERAKTKVKAKIRKMNNLGIAKAKALLEQTEAKVKAAARVKELAVKEQDLKANKKNTKSEDQVLWQKLLNKGRNLAKAQVKAKGDQAMLELKQEVNQSQRKSKDLDLIFSSK